MLRLPPLIACCFCFSFFNTNAQTKVVGECAITYNIHQIVQTDTTVIGQKFVYIKGNVCKTIFKTPELTQTLIFNTQHDTATIIKEIGLNKLLQYIKYDPLSSANLVSSKKKDSLNLILDYSCEAITLNWSDGTAMDVFFTKAIIPTVTVYEQAFKEIPGLVLAYQLHTIDGSKILYTATKVDFSPITLNVFEVNKTLYQLIE